MIGLYSINRASAGGVLHARGEEPLKTLLVARGRGMIAEAKR